MLEAVPRLELNEIELGNGFSLIPCPSIDQESEFVLWDGQAIVGGTIFNSAENRTAHVWADESLMGGDYSPSVMRVLSGYAYNQPGVGRITTEFDSTSPAAGSHARCLESLGFRLSGIDHGLKTHLYEWIADSFDDDGQRNPGYYFLPVRIISGNFDPPDRWPQGREPLGKTSYADFSPPQPNNT
jgi:hypothetical protein